MDKQFFNWKARQAFLVGMQIGNELQPESPEQTINRLLDAWFARSH